LPTAWLDLTWPQFNGLFDPGEQTIENPSLEQVNRLVAGAREREDGVVAALESGHMPDGRTIK
jgi:hypothetical protein